MQIAVRTCFCLMRDLFCCVRLSVHWCLRLNISLIPPERLMRGADNGCIAKVFDIKARSRCAACDRHFAAAPRHLSPCGADDAQTSERVTRQCRELSTIDAKTSASHFTLSPKLNGMSARMPFFSSEHHRRNASMARVADPLSCSSVRVRGASWTGKG